MGRTMKDTILTLCPPEADNLIGKHQFHVQYKATRDKLGMKQINAARVQMRIPINLQRIKYL